MSLRLREAPVAEAYAALGEATGVQFDLGGAAPADDPRLSLGLIQEPFWAAVTELNKRSGFRVVAVERQPAMRVRLLPGRRSGHAYAVDGPFLGQLSVSRQVRPDIRGSANDGGTVAPQLLLGLYADPTMRPMLLHSVELDELIDDSGRPLPHAAFDRAALGFRRGMATSLFTLSPRPAPLRIARVKLRATVVAAARSELAEIDNLSGAGVPRDAYAAGFTVRAETSPGERGATLVQLTLTRTAATGPAWLRPASRLNLFEPVILDAAGQPLSSFVRKLDWGGRSGLIVVEVAAPPGPPAGGSRTSSGPERLLLEIPTDVAEHDVRLEFGDIAVD